MNLSELYLKTLQLYHKELAMQKSPETAQDALDKYQNWRRKWKGKMDEWIQTEPDGTKISSFQIDLDKFDEWSCFVSNHVKDFDDQPELVSDDEQVPVVNIQEQVPPVVDTPDKPMVYESEEVATDFEDQGLGGGFSFQ
jgi:hypothetical protein